MQLHDGWSGQMRRKIFKAVICKEGLSGTETSDQGTTKEQRVVCVTVERKDILFTEMNRGVC